MKQNIFNSQTFAIVQKSFFNAGESADYVESVRRRIFEHGGKVVGDEHKAIYVVQEDGYCPEIWSNYTDMQDDL